MVNWLTQVMAQVGDARDLGIPDASSASSIQPILNTLFLITGVVSVIFIIIGGLRYVISAGNPESAKQAKNTILYAMIGLAISVAAAAVVGFVLGRLQ